MMVEYKEKLLDYFYHLDHAGTIEGQNVFMAQAGKEEQGRFYR